MQLRDARLCADCDEVHDAQQCPHCASESYYYLTRWIPLPEERVRPRPTTSPTGEAYRQLIAAAENPSRARVPRVVKHGLLGLTAVSVIGWLWRSSGQARAARPESDESSTEP